MQLLLNTETSVAGYVGVEVVVASGNGSNFGPVDGMSFDDADLVKGSAVSAVVSWGGGTLATLSALSGKRVQLRVAMSDAKLFSIRMECAPETPHL